MNQLVCWRGRDTDWTNFKYEYQGILHRVTGYEESSGAWRVERSVGDEWEGAGVIPHIVLLEILVGQLLEELGV